MAKIRNSSAEKSALLLSDLRFLSFSATGSALVALPGTALWTIMMPRRGARPVPVLVAKPGA